MYPPPPPPRPPAQPSASPTVAQPAREIDSETLLKGQACVAIRHGADLYWLRATRQGKLLLTK